MVDERIVSLHLQVEIWLVGCRIGGCMSWTLRWRQEQICQLIPPGAELDMVVGD